MPDITLTIIHVKESMNALLLLGWFYGPSTLFKSHFGAVN